MNNMARKLIRDGSETSKSRYNAISICVGGCVLMMGIMLLFIKAISVESIDGAVLNENFFLLPFAFLLIIGGFLIFLVTGIRNIISIAMYKDGADRRNRFITITICGIVTAILTVLFVLLVMANSGMLS